MVKSIKFCMCSLLALAAAIAGSEDGHEEHHSCSCEAEELGFTIDCGNGEALLAALAALQRDSCDTDCSSAACHKNFLMIQSHHDFCLHEKVPSPVEDAFHDFEGGCEHCSILKKRDPNLPDCPDAVCDDRGNQAYQGLLTNGCLTNCNTSVCANFYRTLRAEHDLCDESTLDRSSETGIHDYEDVCEEFNCNVLPDDESAVNAQLICLDPRENKSESFALTGALPFLVGSLVGLGFAAF